ncbi:MAG: 1-acyl-sn-glycerol-3-phosphate acyltransferase [Cyclobacteriaceae bacterium]|nr:1-acyl-sn-glycerol-3-phosphate acyltransferase [Cyclobacteriaceae bacterium]
MGFIRIIFEKLYIAWVVFVFTFFMILYLPGILLPFLFGERYGTISYQFLKLWSWTFSKLNFIPYEIKGKENIHPGKSYVYVSNHTSSLDIPGVCLTVPTQIRPLAKKELKKIPVFGWIAKNATIIVDRSSNESRRKSMDHLKDVLKRGISILIFPEGTQNRGPEPLKPFYDGAFRIAIETQQPLLPMIILNAGKLMPPKEFTIKPGKIKIFILPEISTEGLLLSDVQALKEKVINQMSEVITQHS